METLSSKLSVEDMLALSKYLELKAKDELHTSPQKKMTHEEALAQMNAASDAIRGKVIPGGFGPDPVAYIRALRDEDTKR